MNPTKNLGVNSDAPEELVIPAPLVAHVVLRQLPTACDLMD